MRRFFLFSLFLLFGLFHFFPHAFAHGGVEKSAGDTTIFLTQNPISPFTGETVTMTFVLKNKQSYDNLTNVRVKLTLIRSYYGDESKDTIIEEREFATDENGAFEFSYVFNTTDYYDTELMFKDAKGIEVTGFLIQPRKPGSTVTKTEPSAANPFIFIAVLCIGCLLGVLSALGVQQNRMFHKK